MRHRDTSGQVTSSVVAVVSVLVIVAALAAFVIGGSGDDTTAASDTASPSPTSQQPTAGDSKADDAGDQAGDKTSDADSPAPQKDQKAKGKKKPTQDTAEPVPVVPDVYVEVYNMTSISGLAGSTAATLQDAGWQVVGIDNWRGNIPASTVYYPDGMAGEAEQLADTLGIGRVRGAVAPMKFDRLTVILTTDFA